ncbi:MAG: Gfo/Idh/MocA family oxidoreductase [Coriobacteriia bacterium]|nr:Gfo/Idh/MocA family oxidoreductase [Coriobacteriia bacterium]
MRRRKYGLVGTGVRGIGSFLKPMVNGLSSVAEVVGLYDINPERARVANRLAETDVPVFTSFEELLGRAKPDAIIVTSTDATHAQYVVGALEAGLDAFSEKPLCTTFEQVQAIRRAAAQSAGRGCVTHNMRFLPDIECIKSEVCRGAIGTILQVRFVETLDRFHGADYFRRWHRRMANGGGLVLQKSSHHFDAVNWLVGSRPSMVTAHGRLAYYGSQGPFRGERCSACAHTEACPHYADIFADPALKALYQGVEHVDGYFRDGCVFGEEIDIHDTVHASVTYENGVELSYSINAYGASESMHIALEGTGGSIEMDTRHDTQWAVGRRDSKKDDGLATDGVGADTMQQVVLRPAFRTDGPRRVLTVPPSSGGHGGADPKMAAMLFGIDPVDDPLGQRATLEEGIQAVLVGIAINESIRRGSRPVAVQTMQS